MERVQAVLCQKTFCGLRGIGASLYDSRSSPYIVLGHELSEVGVGTL